MNNFFKKFIISGLFLGYMRPAPGTWGSAGACGAYLLLRLGLGQEQLTLVLAMVSVAILSTLGCIWLGNFMEEIWGKKDPSKCTLDEWAGQAVTLAFVPVVSDMNTTYIYIAIAFFMFRVFDILKPPPARQAEKLPKGWGVVADDLIAGLFAAIATMIAIKYLLPIVW